MIQRTLAGVLREAAAAAGLGLSADAIPEPELTHPRMKEHGDWATNIALALAGRSGKPPREVAEAIAKEIPRDDLIVDVQVAGPGFINLFLSSTWLYEALRTILEEGPRFGRSDRGGGRRLQVEFVSANPTGPLTIGHARNAAIGDALARLLAFVGWDVEREYYFNDAGGQMDRFGASVEARYLQAVGRDADVPEDGYHGDYVADLAHGILQAEGAGLADLPSDERMARLRDEASRRVLAEIRATLDRFGVRFDSYFSEASLAERGEIEAAVERLRERGYAYEADGAVWFRSTDFGDDKDRVIVRSNGVHTYFGADCAYVIDKFGRGFDHVIYVWGADHHGDVARVRGAAEALGFDVAAVEIVLYQWVSFLRGGEPVPMSKRAGTFIALDQLIDEVGADAARFHLLMFSNDAAMTFDIEAVKRQSLDNPVYYVQYGHARIASILRKAAERGVSRRPWGEVSFEPLGHHTELDLIRTLSELPEVVEAAAAGRAPHRLTKYAEEVAHAFHRFYTECRVVGDDDATTQARLWLSSAAQQVIATTLSLIGVGAPESMERLDDGTD